MMVAVAKKQYGNFVIRIACRFNEVAQMDTDKPDFRVGDFHMEFLVNPLCNENGNIVYERTVPFDGIQNFILYGLCIFGTFNHPVNMQGKVVQIIGVVDIQHVIVENIP